MYGAYTAKMADGRLFSFYHTAENGVCQRAWENGRWGGAMSLAVDARPGFEVSCQEDKFYILYQNRASAAELLSGSERGYVRENPPERWNFGPCRLVASKKGLRLFYEEQYPEGYRLFSVSRPAGSDWGRPKELEQHTGGFNAHVVSGDHGILYYQTGGKETCFGYREFNFDREGEFRPVHVRPAAAYSCLTTADTVHYLYSVRTMMGWRLCYRKLGQAGLTAAVTVHEGVRHEDCVLFIINRKIFVCFINGGQPYVCESVDDGRSFTPASRYSRKFCAQPMKCALISRGFDDASFAAGEVFVDTHNPWDVQMIPDLYEDFYTASSTGKTRGGAAHRAETAAGASDTPRERNQTDFYASSIPSSIPSGIPEESRPGNQMDFYAADIPETSKLRNQIEMLERKVAEKDRQLMMTEGLKRELETQRAVIEKLYRERESFKEGDRGPGMETGKETGKETGREITVNLPL